MIGAMQQQLDFIAYIQRMLVEGDFSATYKFALLHAIADVCVEQPLLSEQSQLVIELPTLADKLITLYWHHAMPFSSDHTGESALLKQNTGAQSKVISVLFECQQNNIRNFRQLKQSPFYKPTFNAAMATLKTGPLWRLQILAKQEDCFLYPHTNSTQFITLNAGIASCFRRFYDLVVYLAKNAWLQKIQSIKHNQALIGPQSQLQEFLFGVDRNALTKAKPVLVELQSNTCFYCQKPMKNDVEIDHFIPFARYANDLGHNFVAAHRACNNNKRDFLAAQQHRERWQNQNLVVNSQIISNELNAYFHCDADKSLAVSNWAYQVAQANNAKLWLANKDHFEEAKLTADIVAFPQAKQPELNQVAKSAVSLKSSDNALKLPYFPNIKIACGHFKTGDESDMELMDAPFGAGKLDPNVHFLAHASGNSMNGGKHPILDGDLLLLELITSDKAGSLRDQIVVIERDDISGDGQYLLRKVNKLPNGQYELIAQNPNYEVMIADESMRTFARFKQVVAE
ncbi:MULTISPECIES: HNH endonuclease [unclassified Pseudoalteromonas]|uniref:HNH endonuclease signature motif containing protein n=1 Tax=unclassified Pseudoalteromonas TaxID=194690 RepID=UPI00110894CB|nr:MULTISPECIES: HNH endonuclease [unclassified Pseudoalteromonas]TMN84759.1 HNH endonuclease [Pseudoalteromonas sp. S410]TMN91024.1 HNH endonuclease [Pseudoalteromonas sp. S408]TMN97903.1 HNH endonuclease [Pseudoalteromonas sp. S407]TMO01299.1 HNH endonuclease [Pseudoalteromonas sp. S409]TMO06775.1 HNH endonuclease [Pseudoalteromonas sp. S186]